MKTARITVILLLLFLTHHHISAQIKTGDIVFQTNLSYFERETVLSRRDQESITSADVNSRIGFSVANNFILGFGLGYYQLDESGRQSVNIDEYIRYNSSLSMIDYYFYAAFQSSITEKLLSNISLDFRFGRGDYEENGNLYGPNIFGSFDYNGKVKDNEVILRPGFMYFLGRSVLLTLNYGELGFSNSTIDSGDNNESNESNLVIASVSPSTLRLGIAFYFSKKEK